MEWFSLLWKIAMSLYLAILATREWSLARSRDPVALQRSWEARPDPNRMATFRLAHVAACMFWVASILWVWLS